MTCRLYTPVNGRCIHGYSDTVTDTEADRVVSDFHTEVRLVVDLGEDPTVRGFVPALTDAQQAFVAVADVGTTSGVDPLTAYHDAVHDAFDQHSGWSIRNDTSDRQLFDALTEGTTQSLSNVAGDIDTAGGVIGVPDEQQAIGLLRELLGLGEGQETLEEDRTEGEETDPDGRGSCETVVVSLSGAVSHVDYDVLLHLDSEYEGATVVEDPDESPEERVERLVEETADRRDTVAVLDEVNDRLSNSDLGVELRYTPETRARIEPLFTILTLVLLFWGGLFTTWSWYQFGGQFRLLLADRFLFVWLARLISAVRPFAVESHTVGAVTFALLFGLGLLSVVWKTGLLSRGGRDTPADTTDPEQTAEELVETLELLSAQIDSDARETLDEVVDAESTVSITDHPVLRKASGTLAILCVAGLVGGGVYWLAQSPSVQRVVYVTGLCGVVLLLEHRGLLVNVLSNGFEFVKRAASRLIQSSRAVWNKVWEHLPSLISIVNKVRRHVSSTVSGITSSDGSDDGTSDPAEREVTVDGKRRDSSATAGESASAEQTTTEHGALFEEFTVEQLLPLGRERALAFGPETDEQQADRVDGRQADGTDTQHSIQTDGSKARQAGEGDEDEFRWSDSSESAGNSHSQNRWGADFSAEATHNAGSQCPSVYRMGNLRLTSDNSSAGRTIRGKPFTYGELFTRPRETATAVQQGELYIQTRDELVKFDTTNEGVAKSTITNGESKVNSLCTGDNYVLRALRGGTVLLYDQSGAFIKLDRSLDEVRGETPVVVSERLMFTTDDENTGRLYKRPAEVLSVVATYTGFDEGDPLCATADSDDNIHVTVGDVYYQISWSNESGPDVDQQSLDTDQPIRTLACGEKYVACASEERVLCWRVANQRGAVSFDIEDVSDLTVRDGGIYAHSGRQIHHIDPETGEVATREFDTTLSDFVVLDHESESRLAVVADGTVEVVPVPKHESDSGRLRDWISFLGDW
jgi:hypothetical protein